MAIESLKSGFWLGADILEVRALFAVRRFGFTTLVI